ncbi:acetyl-CoA hydrolase/transferase family protein [Acuticoccus sediminis]|uniref:acetyl-CoA hydrolase/transferase family protein n=1 Tax=Acuticoccus sediminis TaxID=2184697 RepID=UPI001CFD345B|nr:acetyl-CoA hydrolase/transferase C-terminal domain-containing protein [Acuticoccus sediminis]
MQPVAAKDVSFAPLLQAGDRVVAGQGTAEPTTLVRRLLEEARDGALPPFRLFVGPAISGTLVDTVPDSVTVESYGGIGATAALARRGRLDVFPLHLSAIDRSFRDGRIRADLVLLALCPSVERPGWNLGLARDLAFTAAQRAESRVVGEYQPAMPVCRGGDIGEPALAALVTAEAPPVEFVAPEPDATIRRIAGRIAELIPDGACVQMGFGTIPAALCAALTGHRDLGVHSGAVVDGVVTLAECGALTNARKEHGRGVTVGGMLLGTRRLFDFADRNPAFRLAGHEETHYGEVLSAISRFHAVNSALEVDLTGQVGAEIVGGRYIGAVGGQVDYVRAAQASDGGRSIIALPSTTAKGRSRIVAHVGTVTCARADADTFVTEHGVAELRGQPISERIRRMVAIAAPEHRETLLRDWHDAARVA